MCFNISDGNSGSNYDYSNGSAAAAQSVSWYVGYSNHKISDVDVDELGSTARKMPHTNLPHVTMEAIMKRFKETGKHPQCFVKFD